MASTYFKEPRYTFLYIKNIRSFIYYCILVYIAKMTTTKLQTQINICKIPLIHFGNYLKIFFLSIFEVSIYHLTKFQTHIVTY